MIIGGIDYNLDFMQELHEQLSPDLVEYLFPGLKGMPTPSEMLERIGAPKIKKSIRSHNRGGQIRYRYSGHDLLEPDVDLSIDISQESVDSLGSEEAYLISEKSSDEINFSYIRNEEPLDARTKSILQAWERIEEEFGITIEEMELLLGYRVKLSRLNISRTGKIVLTDWGENGVVVKMDDLTKAIYFFYLRHPEGVALKELLSYEDEILRLYLSITGRDKAEAIRKSVENLLDPFGNNLNVSISRIKKAFKDVVGDRIARFYYIQGRAGETRKISLDRDLVIWDH